MFKGPKLSNNEVVAPKEEEEEEEDRLYWILQKIGQYFRKDQT
jgi:hypothetical protein